MLIVLNVLTMIMWVVAAGYGACLGFLAPASDVNAALSGFLVNGSLFGSMAVNGIALPLLSYATAGEYTGKLYRPECWKVFIPTTIALIGTVFGVTWMMVIFGLTGLIFYFNYLGQSVSLGSEEQYYHHKREMRAMNDSQREVDAICDMINGRK